MAVPVAGTEVNVGINGVAVPTCLVIRGVVAATGGTGTFATMHRTRRYKLCVYHGKGVGELFDLESDPWEHENLWNDAAHADKKCQLLAESFDAHVLLTTDMGSKRIAPM